MAFLENLDKRRKFDTIVTVGVLAGAFIFSAFVVIYAFSFAQGERSKIYVLDGDMPHIATHTEANVTIDIEAKAHIIRFHEIFFNLAPDDKYIQDNIERAMYLIDESGLAQYNTLRERGFYNNIVAASATFSILADSVKFNKDNMSFIYYGKQRIERRTSILFRELVTEGSIQRVPRSENNPHGLLIVNYRTVRNRDLEYKEKSRY